MFKEGFHAGDTVWAVFQDAAGLEYKSVLCKIKSAQLRDGRKVTYRISEINKEISGNRIFHTDMEAKTCCDKLNRRQKERLAKK